MLPDGNVYYCTLCPNHRIKSVQEGLLHFKEKHPDVKLHKFQLYPCDLCPHVARSQSLLSYHLKMHTQKCQYRCRHCYYIDRVKRSHQCRSKMTKLERCEGLDQELPGATEGDVGHKSEHVEFDDQFPPGYKFYCGYCPAAISSLSAYKQHMSESHKQIKHPKKLVCCKKCPHVTFEGDAFDNHLIMHNRDPVFKCNACHFLTSKRNFATRHVSHKRLCQDKDIVLIKEKGMLSSEQRHGIGVVCQLPNEDFNSRR